MDIDVAFPKLSKKAGWRYAWLRAKHVYLVDISASHQGI